jgi:hypothetical protein
MKIIRKVMTTLGSIFLAALLLAALAPRAARGVAAALVQVTNTTANPVPTTSVSTPVPFFANLCVEPVVFECQPNTNFFLVPKETSNSVPVKWLVIDQVGAECTSFTNNPVITPRIVFGVPQANVSQSITQQAFAFPSIPAGVPNVLGAVVETQVRIYVAPDFFVFGGITVQPNGAAGVCFMNFQGHLET